MKTRMKMFAAVGALGVCLAGIVLRGDEKSATIHGYVIDSACTFTKNLEKPVSRDCALKCAKAGSQLVILADDKTIYWPIADSMPASGQNAKLTPYAGSRVTVEGKVYERGGSKALVIEKVEAEKK